MSRPPGARTAPVALTIAGSDSSGGAGIQADLACFLALGVRCASAVTALTAQSVEGIAAIHPVPPAFVGEQIRQACSGAGAPVRAAKTGMLHSAATVAAVAEAVRACSVPNLVVDPVLASTSGTRLLARDGIAGLRTDLLPLASVVTPNLAEAAALAGRPVDDMAAMHEAARVLHGLGPTWVLVTGGHLTGDPVDLLFDGDVFIELPGPRIARPNTHGTGCVLSAGIAAHLALGLGVPEAVAAAKSHVTGAIRHGDRAGGPDPAWNLRGGQERGRPIGGSR